MSHSAYGHLLGQSHAYPDRYSPNLLEGIPRLRGREGLLGDGQWPHFGSDTWTLYEVAFRLPDGRPEVGAAVLVVPADSPNIVESKSLKLYLFSLNQERFDSRAACAAQICADVGRAVGAEVTLRWCGPEDAAWQPGAVPGICIDGAAYAPMPLSEAAAALTAQGPVVRETLHSEVLRSLCPVTAQPDWATVVVSYAGKQLQRDRLLSYVAAFFDHQGFHEQCVERIFLDIHKLGTCTELTVYARYTRRGGIDINPLRSTEPTWPAMVRCLRQ